MSEAAFTPGPWWVPQGEDRAGIPVPINSNPHNIAYAYFVNGRANARLIASAPDLYRYLEGAVHALEAFGVADGGLPEMRAALSKARGEQSRGEGL